MSERNISKWRIYVSQRNISKNISKWRKCHRDIFWEIFQNGENITEKDILKETFEDRRRNVTKKYLKM